MKQFNSAKWSLAMSSIDNDQCVNTYMRIMPALPLSDQGIVDELIEETGAGCGLVFDDAVELVVKALALCGELERGQDDEQ